MSKTATTLMAMYQAMRDRFGHQKWWPGLTPLEICVGAILTQNTNWRNVEKAIANLHAAGCMTLSSLAVRPLGELAELIRPAGYYNIKAKRLQNFVVRAVGYLRGRGIEPDGTPRELDAFFNRSVSALREDLLAINGIGRETADSMVLYAAGKLTFVVDAYTYRVLLRHRLIAREDDYEAIKELCESNLPADVELFNDYHAQLVAVGKNFCRPIARCEGCPLDAFPHDREAGAAE